VGKFSFFNFLRDSKFWENFKAVFPINLFMLLPGFDKLSAAKKYQCYFFQVGESNILFLILFDTNEKFHP